MGRLRARGAVRQGVHGRQLSGGSAREGRGRREGSGAGGRAAGGVPLAAETHRSRNGVRSAGAARRHQCVGAGRWCRHPLGAQLRDRIHREPRFHVPGAGGARAAQARGRAVHRRAGAADRRGAGDARGRRGATGRRQVGRILARPRPHELHVAGGAGAAFARDPSRHARHADRRHGRGGPDSGGRVQIRDGHRRDRGHRQGNQAAQRDARWNGRGWSVRAEAQLSHSEGRRGLCDGTRLSGRARHARGALEGGEGTLARWGRCAVRGTL